MTNEPKQPDEPTSDADVNPQPVAPPPEYAMPNQPDPAVPQSSAIPPSGYPPPNGGTLPPTGYPPPYAGYMPPPGYPPPFAGNVPPGTVPPGYPPQPQYFMPMAFPPPPAYAVPPPYVGYPWEIVPPAPGNLVQAWFAIATKLSRRTIAAWAQAIKPDWTAWSIGVGVILTAIAGILNGYRLINYTYPNSVVANDPQTAAFVQTTQNIVRGEGIALIILTPVLLIVNVFVIPWFWSFFMTPLLGSPRQRFQRAFKPFALIQPVIATVALVEALISLAFFEFAPGVRTLTSLISLPLLAYTTALNIQVGSVGSGLKRWPVFGIQLLAGAASGLVLVVVGIIALIIFFATQPH